MRGSLQDVAVTRAEAREEPRLNGYKVTVDHTWDHYNAYALVTSMLGVTPERWHLERRSRREVDCLGDPLTITWHLIHAKVDGAWRLRCISEEKATRLLNLGITHTSLHDRKYAERMKIFMESTPGGS